MLPCGARFFGLIVASATLLRVAIMTDLMLNNSAAALKFISSPKVPSTHRI